jgi:hypothetical protein
MAIREGRWDCPACGSKGILGRHTLCSQCGRPRPQGITFYLPSDADEISNPSLLAIAQDGADWICQYCSASNRTADVFCTQCGAARGSSPTQAVQTHGLDEVPRSGKEPSKLSTSQAVASKVSKKSFLSFKRAIATLALSLTLGTGTWFVMPRSFQTTVSNVSWERQILIEHYVTVTESDWSIPPGGRLISQSREIKEYVRVLDHYETRTRQVSEQVAVGSETYVCGQRDLGNGFFEDETCSRTLYETRTRTETYEEPIYRQDPIYATKYTYDIERWVHARTETTQGNDPNPVWASVTLAGNEREGDRQEIYAVQFTDTKGKPYRYEFSEAEWATFAMGESCKLTLQYGKLNDIDCE